MKRFVGILLVALVVMLSCVRAEEGLQDAAKPNEALEQGLPPGVSLVGDQVPIAKEYFGGGGFGGGGFGGGGFGGGGFGGGGGGGFIPTSGISYRWRFTYPYGGGFRYGWRYPLNWWYRFGRPIYGSSCMFGRPYGGFFYC